MDEKDKAILKCRVERKQRLRDLKGLLYAYGGTFHGRTILLFSPQDALETAPSGMIKVYSDGLKSLLCLIMHYTHGSRH
jgi:hypothetical protein